MNCRNPKDVEIRAHWSPMSGNTELLVTQGYQEFDSSQPYSVVSEVVMTQVDRAKPISYDVYPTFQLSNRNAQALMDQLWQCGVRPTEGKGSAGQLKAVEYHLEDMRKLVFNDQLKK